MFYEPVWDYGGYDLVKRPDTPNFHIAWYDEEARRYRRESTRTADLDLAKERLIEFAAQQARAADPHVLLEPHEVEIADVIEYYLKRHMTPEHPSRATTEYNLKPLVLFAEQEGLTRVADLHSDVLDQYPEFRNRHYRENQLTRLRGYAPYRGWSDAELAAKLKDISDATLARELSVLNAALRFYHKRGRITRVPFIQLPAAVPPRSRWLRPQEFTRLWRAAASQHLRDFMLLAIHTLQRPGFIYDLRVEQVDLMQDRIEFLKSGQRQTKKGRPAIRISNKLRPVLERLVASSVSGYVLEHNERPIRTDIRRAFNAAVARAGLDTDPEPVVPYTLRHTGATWLAQAGVDLWQIAGMLGHRDTRMVERVYAKHHPEFQAKASETLDRLIEVGEDHLAAECSNVHPFRGRA